MSIAERWATNKAFLDKIIELERGLLCKLMHILKMSQDILRRKFDICLNMDIKSYKEVGVWDPNNYGCRIC